MKVTKAKRRTEKGEGDERCKVEILVVCNSVQPCIRIRYKEINKKIIAYSSEIVFKRKRKLIKSAMLQEGNKMGKKKPKVIQKL